MHTSRSSTKLRFFAPKDFSERSSDLATRINQEAGEEGKIVQVNMTTDKYGSVNLVAVLIETAPPGPSRRQLIRQALELLRVGR